MTAGPNIYRGTRLPSGKTTDTLAYIFACPVEDCRYELACHTLEAATTVEHTHYLTSGGADHHRHLLDRPWGEFVAAAS